MVIHPQLLQDISGSLRGDRSYNRPLSARSSEVTVRRATDADAGAVGRVAALDSAQAPAAPVLVAEVDGTPVAAISLVDGHIVADPFELTADVVELLRLRAAQLDGRGSLPAAARGRGRVRLPVLSRVR